MSRTPRVVHVVGAMNRAGVESWLMQVARHVPSDDLRLVFVVHSDEPSDYDEEIRSLGHEIAVVPLCGGPLRYAIRFYRLLRATPELRAVHSHVNHFSALPVVVAQVARVPVRIGHGHSDLRTVHGSSARSRRVYYRVTSGILRHSSTLGLASSPAACRSLFRRDPEPGGRFQVMPTGVDLDAFAVARDEDLLVHHGVAASAPLVLHVARFVPVKNHSLVLDVAEALARMLPGVRVAMVGTGPLEDVVGGEVDRRGLGDVVLMLGSRSDVPALLARADALILPSHYEGVPVCVLEAQASGLPCVVSDAVSAEVDEVPGRVRHLPLEDADSWAEAVLAAVERPRDADADREVMRSGRYDITTTVQRLRSIWEGSR